MAAPHLQSARGARDIASLGRPDLLTAGAPSAPAGQENHICANGPLVSYPSPEKWDDWHEYESTHWPDKVRRNYMLVPTLCFNCEAGCGLLAYVDKDDLKIRKIEGNPLHPASRGRNCAKGWVTVNQIYDPDRIMYPMKRAGERGEGKWERVSWDEALDDIAGRIRKAIIEERRNEIVYHVGRPGEDGFMFHTLASWGVDGHNSHTNVCSSSARIGQVLWNGGDRPSPDFTNAETILLISSHLDTGHYYNPSAQRIIEAHSAGAQLIVIDPRLSNTAAKADHWLPAYSGTESAILLAFARHLLETGQFDAEFVEEWFNWGEYMAALHPGDEATFENFVTRMKEEYAEFTFAYAAEETGVAADRIAEAAQAVARAGSRLSVHVWRAAATGNLHGWQIARCLHLLPSLTGAVGTVGGTHLAGWHKFAPAHPNPAPGPGEWNELLYPPEYPLAHYEMSFLMPHLMREKGHKVDTYFTRVYNPVWTNPDGFMWIEMLKNHDRMGCHVALTPTWNETAWFADYVLPMGIATERHDNQSQETHPARWVGLRQPVMRAARERLGETIADSRETNPGEVWEEDELHIELSWRIDPDGKLGIRRYFESPYRTGEKITVDEYYRYMFENNVPGLPEAAEKEGLAPLEYMRRYGVFTPEDKVCEVHMRELAPDALEGAEVDEASGTLRKEGKAVGNMSRGAARAGFGTPSRKLEFYSPTMTEWKWPEQALPRYVKTHVYWRDMDRSANEFDLLPNYRLPTLIHTRSAVKWLYEIAHNNPLWIHPSDARRIGVATGGLVRVETQIGHYVTRCWATEGLKPGIVAMAHHLGRWRLSETMGAPRIASSLVRIDEKEEGRYAMRQIHGAEPFESEDPDTSRIWWREVGVNQNLAFPVNPDPVSGMHCWHQPVKVHKAAPHERYGDIEVDTEKSYAHYKKWLELTRPAPGPGGLRRPLWFNRPNKPQPGSFKMTE
ncbi:MAG: molybdopterin-dependent oxidoreductase [Nitrospinota bacterium]|nr:molybdopterin-dependent oxidoreductase [Nitrospinota bacterium]